MRIAVALGIVIALATDAGANGRDPYTSTITFQRGNDQHIFAGMTFGALVTTDGGQNWHWLCEDAVGYTGMYDPDYAYTSSGAVFATTFTGLKIMRDGCTFNAAPLGMTFASKVEAGPDGAIYAAAADPMDSKIYKSTDDGVTFPTAATPGEPNDWWSSLMVAPSNASIVYLSGFRLVTNQPKLLLMFKSTNGGTSFNAMPLTGISPVSAGSSIEVVGVAPTAPDTVYIKVTVESGTTGDSIYRWNGTSWTKILSRASNFPLSFLARNDGTCIAGTRELGAWRSTTCASDASFVALPNAPHIGCLAQDSTGTVYACTQNYASPQLGITSDDYGIMKSSDATLSTWTGVLRFREIKAPVQCAAGTVQQDQCVAEYMGQRSIWCCLLKQLELTSTVVDCTGERACFGNLVDGAVGGDTTVPPPKKGCLGCASGSSSPPVVLGLFVAGALLLRRKRAKER